MEGELEAIGVVTAEHVKQEVGRDMVCVDGNQITKGPCAEEFGFYLINDQEPLMSQSEAEE